MTKKIFFFKFYSKNLWVDMAPRPLWLSLCLQTKERSWVNCRFSTAWHQNSEPGFCAVCVVPANKLLLQEINQLIGIELLTSNFLESFIVLSPNFQRGANARFVPGADPAKKAKGAISVIFVGQVSLRVHYFKDEAYFTTLLWQNNGFRGERSPWF